MNITSPHSSPHWRHRLGVSLFALTLLATFPELQASVGSKVVEGLIEASGRTAGAAEVRAASQTAERGLLKPSESVTSAAAFRGSEILRLAGFSENAPSALAACPESIMAIARHWGDEAAVIEMKAPACGEVLASHLDRSQLAELAASASPHELQRLAIIGMHGTPQQLEMAASLLKRRCVGVLKQLTPARIAAYGFSAAVIIAAVRTPHEVTQVLGSMILGLLGPTLMVASWALALFFVWVLRRPVLYLLRQIIGLGCEAWRRLRQRRGICSRCSASL